MPFAFLQESPDIPALLQLVFLFSAGCINEVIKKSLLPENRDEDSRYHPD
jgi:hypothetical protein